MLCKNRALSQRKTPFLPGLTHSSLVWHIPIWSDTSARNFLVCSELQEPSALINGKPSFDIEQLMAIHIDWLQCDVACGFSCRGGWAVKDRLPPESIRPCSRPNSRSKAFRIRLLIRNRERDCRVSSPPVCERSYYSTVQRILRILVNITLVNVCWGCLDKRTRLCTIVHAGLLPGLLLEVYRSAEISIWPLVFSGSVTKFVSFVYSKSVCWPLADLRGCPWIVLMRLFLQSLSSNWELLDASPCLGWG